MANHSISLLACLQAETQSINQFFDTLQAEQKALINNDVNALSELSQTKLKQVEALNKLASERMRQLAAAGFTANETGMEQWLMMAGDDERKIWKDLLSIAREANSCNQINGKLIQQSVQRHQQALAALMTAANQVSLYGADGHPQGGYLGASASRGIIGTA